MTDRAPSFGEIVEARLSALGTNAFAVSQASGVAYDKFRNVIRKDGRRADPKFETAREICAALGLELYVGLPRVVGPILTTEIGGEDFAAVPRYDAHLSAGPGSDNTDDEPSGAIAFRRDWLEREGISAPQAMVMTVRGDSMAPTLRDGDLVMIDRRRTQPRNRHIYALVGPEGQARVKRVERLPTALLLHSDNDTVPTEIIAPSEANRVRILGEVVWWGHTVRE